MATYGLTDTGFVKKRLPEIKAEREADFRGIFGDAINLLPTSVFGQLVGTSAEREALLWDLLEALYDSAYPDTAEGISLDYAVALTGISRLQATYSSVTMRVFGTVGTTVPGTFTASVAGLPANKFKALVPGTIGPGINAVQTIMFSSVPTTGTWTLTFGGQTTTTLAYNASTGVIQSALNTLSSLNAGITVGGNYLTGITVAFGGADGQKPQPLLAVTNNVLQNGLGAGVTATVTTTITGFRPYVDLFARAVSTGAVTAPAGTLTVIETPTYGIDGVTNLLDATVGREREKDSELRLRRLQNLQRQGSATVNGILSTVRAIADVSTAFVFENNTDGTVSGRPPHSYEVFVQGGSTDDILSAIWRTKPAGIRTVGTITGTVLDSQGFVQSVSFSRPAEINIYITVTVTKNTDPSEPGGVYPLNGDTLVREAVMAYANTFQIGQNVVVSRFFTAINEIPGVVGIDIKVGTSPSPTLSNNIAIGSTEIAKFDTSRLSVVSV